MEISKLTKAGFLLESRRGETLRTQGRAVEAERVFRALLARMDAGADYDTGYNRATTLGDVGRCLRAQGKPSAAAEMHKQALVAWAKLQQTDNVRQMQAADHTDLADVLGDLAQYEEAQKHYEAALQIARAIGNERQAAVDLAQIGTLALAQGDLAEARRRHTEALLASRNLGESQMESVAWFNLGKVARRARDLEEAERCYKESLSINERSDNKGSAAITCNSLALVAEDAGRLEEAERWYKRAVVLNTEIGNQVDLAMNYNNLADLLQSQNRLDGAEAHAHRAREIKETLDLSSNTWTTYEILARIAEKRGRAEEAREWRRKAEEYKRAFAAQSGGQWSEDGAQVAQQVQKWEPVIAAVVAACQGNKQAAQAIEPVLQKFAGTKDWGNLVAVIRRILKRERGAQLAAGLDRVDAAIVQKILEGVQ